MTLKKHPNPGIVKNKKVLVVLAFALNKREGVKTTCFFAYPSDH